MRDHRWLEEQLEFLLKKYFANVAITNPIEIRWGREAKYRFGSIKLVSGKRDKGFKGIKSLIHSIGDSKPEKSIITVTSMFRDEQVPLGVVYYTIAHELCHYAHGFSSTNKRLFRHPHHGGVINRELKERGAEMLIPIFKRWLKVYRAQILKERQFG